MENSPESGWSFCKIMCVCSHVHVSKINKTSSSLSVSRLATYIPLTLFLFQQLSTSLTSLPFLLSPTADQWGVQHSSSSHHEPKTAAWSLEKHLLIVRVGFYYIVLVSIIVLSLFTWHISVSREPASHDLCMCIKSHDLYHVLGSLLWKSISASQISRYAAHKWTNSLETLHFEQKYSAILLYYICILLANIYSCTMFSSVPNTLAWTGCALASSQRSASGYSPSGLYT